MDAMMKELLFLSVRRGYNDIIRILVKYGCNLNVRNEQNETPLTFANFKRPSLIKLLIDSGANVNLARPDGCGPIHIAAKSGNVKSVQFLLAAGANIDLQTNEMSERETALHFAVRENHKDVVNLLLHKGAAVNIDADESALSLAAGCKHSVLIKTLLKYGADVHFRCYQDGSTPLHILVWVTDKRLIKLILRRTIDVDHKDSNESTALNLAAGHNNPIFVEMLLDHGAQVDSVDQCCGTALHHATRYQQYHDIDKSCYIIKLLLDRGSDPTIMSCYYGETPLHDAAEYLHLSAFKLFLEHGADINTTDRCGATVLHYAVKNPCIDVIKFLVDTAGMDVNARCRVYGKTAFHDCSSREIRIFLLDRGFNIHAKSVTGQTLLSGFPNFIEDKKLLLEHMAKQQSVGIIVDEFDKEVITKNNEYQQYFNLCTEELKKMKATIARDNISFHEVLTASNRMLSGYAKNSKLTQIVTDSNVEEMFPIYYKTMRIRFDPEIIKQNRIQKAIEFLNDIFQNYDPFNIVSVEVVKYLNDEDFKMLMC